MVDELRVVKFPRRRAEFSNYLSLSFVVVMTSFMLLLYVLEGKNKGRGSGSPPDIRRGRGSGHCHTVLVSGSDVSSQNWVSEKVFILDLIGFRSFSIEKNLSAQNVSKPL